MFFPTNSPLHQDGTVVATAFELVSHVVALPYIWELVKYKKIYEAMALSASVVMSLMYHMCNGFFFCFALSREDSRLGDYIFSNYIVPVVFLSILQGDHPERAPIIVTRFALLALTVYAQLAFRFQFTAVVFLTMGTCLAVPAMLLFLRNHFRLPSAKRFRPWLMLASVLLAGAGVALFLADANGVYYDYLHPIWHVLIYTAAYLAIVSANKGTMPLLLVDTQCGG